MYLIVSGVTVCVQSSHCQARLCWAQQVSSLQSLRTGVYKVVTVDNIVLFCLVSISGSRPSSPGQSCIFALAESLSINHQVIDWSDFLCNFISVVSLSPLHICVCKLLALIYSWMLRSVLFKINPPLWSLSLSKEFIRCSFTTPRLPTWSAVHHCHH